MILGWYMQIFWFKKIYPKVQKNLFIKFKPKILNFRDWRFFYSGFYGDEAFGRFIEQLSKYFFLAPALFILDRWWSQWFGIIWVKKVLNWLTSKLFYSHIDILFIIHLLLLVWMVLILGSWLINFLC